MDNSQQSRPNSGPSKIGIAKNSTPYGTSVLGLQRLADVELTQVQSALAESTRQLAVSLSLLTATLESTPDGISVDDLAGRIVLYNSHFVSMWSLDSELIASGRTIDVARFIESQVSDKTRYRHQFDKANQHPENVTKDIFHLADGRTFERHASPHRVGGECVGIVTNWRDVTDRETAVEVMRAKDEAERANRAKSEFIGRMSHELRTPLNAVLGFSEILRLDPREPLTLNQTLRVAQIHTAGSHLLLLIDDLLDVARMEAGSLRISVENIDVAEIVLQAVGDLAMNAEAVNVSVDFERDDALAVLAQGDRIRLKQVLHNLLSNGIKYNRGGGRVRVHARVDASRGRTTIEVVDDGIGMDDGQLLRLFRPFDRLGMEQSDVEGTGIGLVIARNYIELMGGNLTVTSKAGAGSTFKVELPCAIVATSQEHIPSKIVDVDVDSKTRFSGRVLYVEDDEVNRLLMAAFFQTRVDIELFIAVDGRTGIKMAREVMPDIFLIDMMLPDIGGADVLAAIREFEHCANTPCIAVSANAQPAEIEFAMNAGFDSYLTKPLTLSRLMREVDRFGVVEHPR